MPSLIEQARIDAQLDAPEQTQQMLANDVAAIRVQIETLSRARKPISWLGTVFAISFGILLAPVIAGVLMLLIPAISVFVGAAINGATHAANGVDQPARSAPAMRSRP